MSAGKGSGRRPGTGFAEGFERIFGRPEAKPGAPESLAYIDAMMVVDAARNARLEEYLALRADRRVAVEPVEVERRKGGDRRKA